MSCFQALHSSPTTTTSSSAALLFPAAAVSELQNSKCCFSQYSLVLGTRSVPGPAPLHAIAVDTQPRRSADYTPNIWGNHFIATSPTALGIESEVEEHEKLKQEVRGVIADAMEDPNKNLDLIDAIQRLGVSYHFEEEVEEFLQKTHANLHGFIKDNADNLQQISLCFRLLRQHGYQVSCNMFTNFIEDDGSFRGSLKQDFEGLMSLYEAAHLRVHGEEILENALAFSTTQLKLIAKAGSKFSAIINHSLRNPIRKNFPRLDTRFYISVYQEIKPNSHNPYLLQFSKLDFNLVQKQYREELNQISRWWNELDAETKFPFARNRIVEAFFFIMGTYFEPRYKLGRKIATKALAMLTILDDIYDVHGTPQELDLLTQALERWDPNLASEMPEYIKNFYVALLDTFKDLEEDMGTAQGADDHVADKIKYCKEGLIKVAKAYHTEAKWYEQNYTPTMEEYMEVALVSVATPFIGAMVLLGMGHLANKDAFEWFRTHPKIVASACLIPRLQDDIVGHEFEQKRGHSASCVDCYVKEHGKGKEEAVEAFYKQASDAWKDANADFIRPTAVPMQVLTTLLNISRIAHVVYNDCDGYADPHAIKALVASVFVHPIPYN
uniref:(+)-delta-cadinene synthase n=1 Tax=Daphne genkwa TaxID=1477590 RepID=A0A977LIC4_9ROSI|nr:terpene synthase 1 [Daphne genkwa]